MSNKALIITSIADDKHPVLRTFASECDRRGIPFIVIGDLRSPARFELQGCDFWSIERQQSLPFSLAAITPTRHYSRKNLGYLLAIRNGATELQETDDDNIPAQDFWLERSRNVNSLHFLNKGWVNVYHYFTKHKIWPRGFPLEELQTGQTPSDTLERKENLCPVQQGLANGNPDVDAVYRLTGQLPLDFEIRNRIALGKNAWSPFNSQNTYWFREAFPLLYLPSYCSFRMTDIWRSYVAQRIAWEYGWNILYHEPTVSQERNEHNLMKDFEDEIPGYTNNRRICQALEELSLSSAESDISGNLLRCYERLIEMEVIGKEEMQLLNAWISDLRAIS